MCGIAGEWSVGRTPEELAATAERMAASLFLRGPDGSGVWVDSDGGVALAHRRLSILDLSPAGHQPMVSAGSRWVIAYNGEVYNHGELRQELEANGVAPSWRGHSDTETLLACIEAWGVEAAVKRFVGMFAFALWDRDRRELWLARDRLGEKPLYYGWQGDTFLFGSELKALREHPAFNASIDRGALLLLLRHNYVPDPYSIWRGIHKLQPGSCLVLRNGEREPKPVAYWSLSDIAERGSAQPFLGSDDEAVDALAEVLGKAVRQQMVADVPLGALLSGGIDSTLITALMQASSNRAVRTFTIGFGERDFDESVHARAIAAHLGTEHTEINLSAQDALGLIPQLSQIYDEPFADSSQLPTYLVMQLARQHVTVALSGDAGDEFFGGYNRYRFLPKVWNSLGRMPRVARAPAISLALLGPGILGRALGATQVANKLSKVQRLFDGRPRDLDDLYLAAVSEWSDAEGMVVGGGVPSNLLDSRDQWPALEDPVARMMALDALTYLPGDTSH